MYNQTGNQTSTANSTQLVQLVTNQAIQAAQAAQAANQAASQALQAAAQVTQALAIQVTPSSFAPWQQSLAAPSNQIGNKFM